MFHNTTVVGNLGRDPDMRYMPDGNAVTNFSVAVSDFVSGEKQTMWVRVSAWGKQAENCNQYLKKGSKVLVQGRLRFDSATGGPALFSRTDGTQSASFELTADKVVFLSSKAESGPHDEQHDAAAPTVPAVQETENIPF
jgi:single-strand DNA-binding protein